MPTLLARYFCSVLSHKRIGRSAHAWARTAFFVVASSASVLLAMSDRAALAQSGGDERAATGGAPQGGFVSGEILVRFKDDVSDAEIDAMIQSYGGRVLDYIEKLKVYHLQIPEGRSVEEMINLYANDPRCEYVERNYIGEGGGFIPNDTFFVDQWHLNNEGQTGGTADADIDAVEGWQITQGDPSVVVAILDTGIDRKHREFRRRLLPATTSSTRMATLQRTIPTASWSPAFLQRTVTMASGSPGSIVESRSCRSKCWIRTIAARLSIWQRAWSSRPTRMPTSSV